MSREMLDSPSLGELRALAVIVLYKLLPGESAAVSSLKAAMKHIDRPKVNIQALIFDNTPGGQDPGSLPDGFRYFAAGENAGLAAAYNYALALAESEGLDWLLTLDQDTSLPPDYLLRIGLLARNLQQDQPVAAIVPTIKNGAAVISPLYVCLLRNYAVPEHFIGLNDREIYALNSAALLRTAAVREMGGFPEEFWLDQLDLVLHHRLHRAGKRVYIAGDLAIQHDLSLQDYRSLSPDRFRNFLQSESAFYDLYKGAFERLILTATLLFRYVKHKAKRTNPAIIEEIFKVLKQRVIYSQAARTQQWRLSMGIRPPARGAGQGNATQAAGPPRISVCMAAYNGERFIAAQLKSILDQLAMNDEVVVVDDASLDDTCGAIGSLNDSRIRLVRRESNEGVLRSFEDALKIAEGEILFLSDQDDLWAADKVSTVLDAFRSNPEADIVVSDAALINQEGALIGSSYYRARRSFEPGVLANILHCRYLGCTMAIHTRIRSRILPFPKGADVFHDLWIGTANAFFGGKTLYIDRPLVQYRRHQGNATGNRRLSLRRQLQIRWDLCRSLLRTRFNPRRTALQ